MVEDHFAARFLPGGPVSADPFAKDFAAADFLPRLRITAYRFIEKLTADHFCGCLARDENCSEDKAFHAIYPFGFFPLSADFWENFSLRMESDGMSMERLKELEATAYESNAEREEFRSHLEDAWPKLLAVVEAAEDRAYCEDPSFTENWSAVECCVCSGCKLRKALDEVTG